MVVVVVVVVVASESEAVRAGEGVEHGDACVHEGSVGGGVRDEVGGHESSGRVERSPSKSANVVGPSGGR